MHGVEAMVATGDPLWLERAERITQRLVGREPPAAERALRRRLAAAAALQPRRARASVPALRRDVGHWFEWARLAFGSASRPRRGGCSRRGVHDGWDGSGSSTPSTWTGGRSSAPAALGAVRGDRGGRGAGRDALQRAWWELAERHFIDRERRLVVARARRGQPAVEHRLGRQARRLPRARRRSPQVCALTGVDALMRPFLLAVVLMGLLAAPADAQFQSSNVSLLRKLPQSAGAIGARFSEDGDDDVRDSATGLQIYDISQPETPKQLSQLPLPHFENEDVDVGRDTVVITNDPSFSGVGAIYLIDVVRPGAPGAALGAADQRPGRGTTTPRTGTSRTASRAATTSTRRAPPRASRSTTSATSRRRSTSRRSAARRGLHARRARRRGRHGVGDGGGRDVRLRRQRSAEPGAALPLRSVDRQHRRRAAGLRRLRPARLPAPQHAAHVDQR